VNNLTASPCHTLGGQSLPSHHRDPRFNTTEIHVELVGKLALDYFTFLLSIAIPSFTIGFCNGQQQQQQYQ
jgi:hypothetical protein